MLRSGSAFSESQTSVIHFPEDKPEDFKLFFSWLYQEKLPKMAFSLATGSDTVWKTLCSFYTLADKFNLVEAMDESIDVFLKSVQRELEWLPKPVLLAEIYSSSPSGLRKLCAHCLAYVLKYVQPESEVEILAGVLHGDIELLFDVLKIINHTFGGVGDPRFILECDFHVHGEKSPCATRDINENDGRVRMSRWNPSPSVGRRGSVGSRGTVGSRGAHSNMS
jgi:hypothetical protein